MDNMYNESVDKYVNVVKRLLEYDELETQIKVVTGMGFREIYDLFLEGYVLIKPNYGVFDKEMLKCADEYFGGKK